MRLERARRAFTPSKHGWTRTTFVRGDVTNREDVRGLVEGTDVVVHLAFLILGGRRETRVTNLQGSRTDGCSICDVTMCADRSPRA